MTDHASNNMSLLSQAKKFCHLDRSKGMFGAYDDFKSFSPTFRILAKSTLVGATTILGLGIGMETSSYISRQLEDTRPSQLQQQFTEITGAKLYLNKQDVTPGSVFSAAEAYLRAQKLGLEETPRIELEPEAFMQKNLKQKVNFLLGNSGSASCDVLTVDSLNARVITHELEHCRTKNILSEELRESWNALSPYQSADITDSEMSGFVSDYARISFEEDVTELATYAFNTKSRGIEEFVNWFSERPFFVLREKTRQATSAGILPAEVLDYVMLQEDSPVSEYKRFVSEHPNSLYAPNAHNEIASRYLSEFSISKDFALLEFAAEELQQVFDKHRGNSTEYELALQLRGHVYFPDHVKYKAISIEYTNRKQEGDLSLLIDGISQL